MTDPRVRPAQGPARPWIEKNFAGIPDSVRRMMVHDNAVARYETDVE